MPVLIARTLLASSSLSTMPSRASNKEDPGAVDSRKRGATAKSLIASKGIANASMLESDVGRAVSARAARTRLSARRRSPRNSQRLRRRRW